ncbi:MAG: hypothetical protein MI864_01880, partial [Pseudomonadales bacterium]|nr:hypothetical protein [Pseudomonadales bacterium]
MRIDHLHVSREVFPLRKPYILSFVTLESFVSLQVHLALEDGSTRSAEVVPLYGYSEETEACIQAYLYEKANLLEGMNIDAARAQVEQDIPETPFATSPLLTAMDLATWRWKKQEVDPGIKFVIPIAAVEPELFEEILKTSRLEGRTIKLKLSGDPAIDIRAVETLERIPEAHQSVFRLDANQAYDLPGARAVFGKINSSPLLSRITYVEQPFPVLNWDDNATMIGEFPDIEIMLDESVITLTDLHRAATMGVGFVKLKLFKQGGLLETLELAKAAS